MRDNFWPGCKKTSSNSFKSCNNFCFSWGVKVEAEERLCSSIGKVALGCVSNLFVVGFSIQTDLIKSLGGELVQGLFGMFSLSLSGGECVS